MLLYSIEGAECSGKTTLLESISHILGEKNVPLEITKAPGGTKIADAIRKLVLQEPMSPECEAMLFYAARKDNLERIITPALSQRKIVLTDRYLDSTAVYQFLLHGKTYDEFLLWENLIMSHTPKPFFTFLLDIPAKETIRRLSLRGIESKFDALPLEKHEAIRQSFLEVAGLNKDRIIVLDGTKPTKELAEEVASYLWHLWEWSVDF